MIHFFVWLIAGLSLAQEAPLNNDATVVPYVHLETRTEASQQQAPQSFSERELKIIQDLFKIIQENYIEEAVSMQELLHGALEGMVNRLQDPHSAFLDPQEQQALYEDVRGSFGGVGLELEQPNKRKPVKVFRTIPSTPADKSEIEIKPGDEIVAIDEQDMTAATLREVVRQLRGPKSTKVTITFQRRFSQEPNAQAQEFQVTLERAEIKVTSISFRMLEPGIGYVQLQSFNKDTAKQLALSITDLQKKEGMKALALDLRNNPGGLLSSAIKAARLFLNKGELVVATKGRDRKVDKTSYAWEDGPFSGIPLVVLVNNRSASASEIVAGAMQDHSKAILVGTKTYGKGSVQTILPLTDDTSVRLTTQLYYTASGRNFNKGKDPESGGIAPDIEVTISPEVDVKLARQLSRQQTQAPLKEAPVEDEALQKAVRLLRTMLLFPHEVLQ